MWRKRPRLRGEIRYNDGVKGMGNRTGLPVKYRFTDHEADVGLVVYGRDYEDMFANGAYALFSVICDLRRVRKKETRQFFIPGKPDALVVFLNEILYMWDVDRFIPKRARVEREGDTFHVFAEGEIFDPERHYIRREIKAATYHGFSILEYEDGCEATLVLDL
jgi:SHS2 domain-containing protein